MRRRWQGLVTFAAVAAMQSGCYFLGIQMRGAREQPEKEIFVLRVNAGMDEPYTDKAGNTWLPDQPYREGAKYGFTGDASDTIDRGRGLKIEGTGDPRIYQTERWSMESFIAAVPNGKYTVGLHFAETYPDIDTDGPRVFSVKVQGEEALRDFNVAKVSGGVCKALIMLFRDVEVTNGELKIDFVPAQQNPEINGVEIIAQ